MNSTLLPLTTPEEELAYSLGYGVGMGLFICLIALIFPKHYFEHRHIPIHQR